ncbi:MAG: DUF4835 family protein [Balneolaceae bacterium]|nr:MAG: DUF4835 family protein [Balneolaceae bacterium]
MLMFISTPISKSPGYTYEPKSGKILQKYLLSGMMYTFKGRRISLLILLSLLLCWPGAVTAQEFNCEVTLNNRQISGSSFDYITELKNDLENYLNTYRWTNDRYETHERIMCNIQVVLTGVDSNFNFTAEVIFTMRRPIYNTNRQSLAIVLSDNNWRFHYPRNKNLIHDDMQFDDLTSFIDFYAYIMLGFDYDSFSELGGTPYFNSAQNVFELGQNSGVQGWGRSIGAQRNRFGLITDLSNPAYEDLRRAIYRYHRLGLDQFTLDEEIARKQILSALEMLRDNKQVTSNNYLFDIFFSSKYTEIVAIFRDADVETRLEAYNLLRNVDPGHSSEYERLQN